ncbi:FAD:protein FMN transferase [Bacillus sp. BRMEA1]|uniref:FAD:protein FMN transferase n=1 Tax=Neobacillus endophyticus TaxID=2738405 RepID=UPI0015639467|nr:FAD:protein FMN transferase [Neobacillus endophyticus]NRD77888.1 FAD:protein FMN transferase [Neobacillus endophyticus]
MRKAKVYMDTIVDIQTVTQKSTIETEEKINRAFQAFQKIEQACSRFSHTSECMQACQNIGKPVEISPLLFQPLFFALEMARLTDGLFDPTVGKLMEENGFNRHYLTGEVMKSSCTESVTFRDIVLNPETRTLLLKKPLVIDLGAVAKGFAIDLAAQELKDLDGFVINAGGDLFAGGLNEDGKPWQIGIQHPYQNNRFIDTVEISNEAICTSGSYERKNHEKVDVHHLVNPKTRRSPQEWISCSIIAPFAMMADALSTISFLLGSEKSKSFIEEFNIKGIMVTPELQIIQTGGI